MKQMIRTFVAIKIIPEQKLLELLAKLRTSLQYELIKWVEPNNLHLTLRFFGDTTPEQIERIGQAVEELATKFRSFQFDFKGIDYFKSKGQPRVLFLKTKGNQALKLLVESLEEKVIRLGFEREFKEFKPHLTLARIKYIEQKDKFDAVVGQMATDRIQSVCVSEIVFYQSILSSAAPEYKPLKIVKLIS